MEKKQKILAQFEKVGYTCYCCDMIAVKREVALLKIKVFRGANVKLGNWRQVTVQQNISATAEKACVISLYFM